jgi:hypothetical protein
MVVPLLPEGINSDSSAASASRAPAASIWRDIGADIRSLVRNTSFLTVLFPYALGLAIFNLLVMQLNTLLAPCTQSALDAPQLTAVMICAGLAGCLAWGVLLSSIRRLAGPLKTGYVIAAVALLLLLFTLRPDGSARDGGVMGLLQAPPLALVFALAGACMLPLMTLSFETAMAVTRGVSIHSMQCVLLAIAQVPSILVSPLVSAFLHDDKYNYTCHHVFSHPFGITLESFIAAALLVIMLLPRNAAVKLGAEDTEKQTPVEAQSAGLGLVV